MRDIKARSRMRDIKAISRRIAKDENSFVMLHKQKKNSNSKAPALKGNLLDNLKSIDYAFSQDKYRVGCIIKENLIRIDIDDIKGVEEYVKSILPDTTIFKTERGYHLFFSVDNPAMFKKGDYLLYNQLQVEVIPHLEKGFAILPYNDKNRSIVNDADIIPLPLEWSIMKKLKLTDNNKKQSLLPIRKGNRDKTLFHIACVLKDKFEKPTLLQKINKYCCSPSMSTEELKTKWKSASNYENNYSSESAFWDSNNKLYEKNEKSGSIKVLVAHVCKYINRNNNYAVLMQNGVAKMLYYWDGKHWTNASQKALVTDTQELIPSNLYTDKLQLSVIKTMMYLLENTHNITDDELNDKTDKIYFEDCVYNVKTCEYENHDINNYNTHYIPHKVRNLPYKKIKDTYYYDKFLRHCDFKPDEAKLLLDWIFYCMIPSEQYKLLLLLTGPSGTGKSMYLKSLTHLVGYNNTSAVSLHNLTGRFTLSEIEHKLLNIDGDGSAESLKDTSAIKKITGNDPVRSERKGKDAYVFTPYAKHVFSFNTLPLQSGDKSDAFFARLRVLDMDKKLTDSKEFKYIQGEEIEKSIIELIPYLLDVVCKRVIKAKNITSSKTSEKHIRDLKMHSDPLNLLFEEKLVKTGNEDDTLTPDDFYSEYETCVDDLGVQPEIRSQKRFIEAMKKRKIPYRQNKNNILFLGYKIIKF